MGPHIWACLQHIVTYVDLPMRLPVKCSGSSHIIMQHKDAAGAEAGLEENIWNPEYGHVRAVLVPENIYHITVTMNGHHLEDLVSADQDWAHTRFSLRRRGASDYLIDIFAAWFRKNGPELFRMRAMAALLWQVAPERWRPLRMHPRTSTTVVGGREAKKEQTQVIAQGAYYLQVDKEYLENRPDASPLCVPMCHSRNRGPCLDLRIYWALVLLYQVQSQCNAGAYESIRGFVTGPQPCGT